MSGHARVISATNRTLIALADRGKFREDVLYRINPITLHVPPLRERPDDIPMLAGRFVHTLAHADGRDDLSISPAAPAGLERQSWPGNMRQLRRWIERTRRSRAA